MESQNISPSEWSGYVLDRTLTNKELRFSRVLPSFDTGT